ncbi:uncharacterized protein LOC123210412 [Mangifera indica]|uniref:uncharacterized protein LOC123210412 n=1 Tax=Mangifera indica TaxID=29780 RepID=UPI001CF9EA18|nr:uncharacterized protein LOC123210412 [Mangifera indica]
MAITRDVHFNEDEQWDWENSQGTNRPSKEFRSDFFEEETTDQWENELIDDPPIRGTRSLSNIYQRCNVALCEPADHEEALKDPKWKKAMKVLRFLLIIKQQLQFHEIQYFTEKQNTSTSSSTS